MRGTVLCQRARASWKHWGETTALTRLVVLVALPGSVPDGLDASEIYES